MTLGDSLTAYALNNGHRMARVSAPSDIIRLAVTLPDDTIQHFERPATGSAGDWRATEFQTPGSGAAFNEPITAEWGCGLEYLINAITS
ncbi:hypothetical protein ABZ214_15545 [Streptomyces iakyrus]|uniref:hypothetical protein n=1 Tax=Streptomyces iakyrus TaxID=68219 RepID=UPI0033A8DDA9